MKPSCATLLCALLLFTNAPEGNASWAEQTLKQLSLEEKIGQLFMVATSVNMQQQEEALVKQFLKSPYNMKHTYIKQLVKEYHIGGIIYLYKATPQAQVALTNEFQSCSNVPLLIGQDCEWGLSMRLYDTVRFPKNITLGAQANLPLIRKLGEEIGRQCRAIGVHINFAPVADIRTTPENPVTHARSFGEDKKLVATCASAYMQGLQEAGIFACAKHFPGHGDTAQDSHLTLPTIAKTKQELYECELQPFKQLIEDGVACVMTGHLKTAFDQTRNLPASLSAHVVHKLLRTELEFDGLAITDAIGMSGVLKYHKAGHAELKAFLAGNDIILCPVDVPKAAALIRKAICEGTVTEQELDTRILKILKAKEQLGLHIDRFVEEDSTTLSAKLHRPESLALKKELFQQAVTCVGCSNLLPLSLKTYKDIAMLQVGGYLPSEFEKIISKSNITTHHLPSNPPEKLITLVSQRLADTPTVVVALFGMNNRTNEDYGIDEKVLQLIEKLHQTTRVILIFFGSPYAVELVDNEIPCIVAYEDDPDSQEGVAQLLLGKSQSS